MSLTFHQTFSLDRDNVAKVLALAAQNPSITNRGIAGASGIGIGKNERKGKVQPTIEYATYAGLLRIASSSDSRERRLELTDVARVVLDFDPWLQSAITIWVMHYFLSREGSEAEAWEFFTHDFLLRYGEFDRATLVVEMKQRFGPKPTIKSIRPGVLLKSYIDSLGLGPIRIVEELRRGRYARTIPNIPNAYVVGYILAELWDAKHPERLMVDRSLLQSRGHLAPTLSLSEIEAQKWLDELRVLGIIDEMRAAPPCQVVKQWDDKLELLKQSYRQG